MDPDIEMIKQGSQQSSPGVEQQTRNPQHQKAIGVHGIGSPSEDALLDKRLTLIDFGLEMIQAQSPVQAKILDDRIEQVYR